MIKKRVEKIIKQLKRTFRAKKVTRKPRKEMSEKKPMQRPRRRLAKSALLVRSEENPIIASRVENSWEAWQTFNPGVILLKDKVYFLYRAIGEDGISRLGYAVSSDGFAIDERLPHPVYRHHIKYPVFNAYSFASGGSFGGAEDPRLVRVNNEDRIYMIYTACDEGLRVALTSIKLEDFLQKRWKWKKPALISSPGETHKNWVLFPKKIGGKYALLTSINPKILVTYRDNLEFGRGEYIKSYYNGARRKNCWDTHVRGAGAPPIKTKYGWLVFYHAIDERDSGKYKVGAMLLDLNDPTKVLRRSSEPILEPEASYENNGFKSGVVYVSGVVVKDGKILIYYGGADSNVCVVYADFDKFLEELNKEAKPKLERRTVTRK